MFRIRRNGSRHAPVGNPEAAAAGGRSGRGGTLQKALSLVGARVLGNVLTLGYTLILARITTPTEFGLIMSAFAWIMLLSVFLALNLESGSIKYLVQYRETGQSGRAAGFIRAPIAVEIAVEASPDALHEQPHVFASDGGKAFQAKDVVLGKQSFDAVSQNIG